MVCSVFIKLFKGADLVKTWMSAQNQLQLYCIACMIHLGSSCNSINFPRQVVDLKKVKNYYAAQLSASSE